MIDFLNTITQLVLNIFGYLLNDTMITLTCICLVLYVFGSFREWVL